MTYWITKVDENAEASSYQSGIIANNMAAESVSQVGFRKLHYPRLYAQELQDMGAGGRRDKLEAILNVVLPGDVVIVQYPLWTSEVQFELEFIDYLKNERHAKTVALIWDIISWIHDDTNRDYSGDASLWLLNKYDLVIAANAKMARHLSETGGVTTPKIAMGLSDFVYHGPLPQHQFKKQLYYVSSSVDPAMVTEYQSDMPIKFIGPNQGTAGLPDYVQMLGKMNSNDIPAKLDDGFGLLYYPKTGFYKGMNNYGHYNNPMKLSLYLAAGLPVITMSGTAHSGWLKERGVGLVIDSIADIDDAVNALSDADYQQMVANVRPWQEAVTSGFFAKQAALEAVRYLELGFEDQLVVTGGDRA